MGASEADQAWMLRALAEAERGRGCVEPNPMVGAMVVVGDHLIAVGHHEIFGGPHAEVIALKRAGDSATGSTLYVTLEPCCHHGKTPPCVDAVIASKVARVVVAVPDPFPKVAGGGIAKLRCAGIAVEVGIERELARLLNAAYFKRLSTGTPFVTAKWAMTLDGKIATASGRSAWISSPRSRAMVHELRGRMDAIVVGIGTALADNPHLTVRPRGPRTPLRVVLDSGARLPLGSHLVRSARDVPLCVVVASEAAKERTEALRASGCDVLDLRDETPGCRINSMLLEFGRRGMTNVLVEGGSRVLASFLEARQIDAVDVFIAPTIEGGSNSYSPIAGKGVETMAEALRLAGLDISVVDGDVRVRGMMPWSVARLSQDDSA